MGGERAHAQELFRAIPSNQIRDGTSAQIQAIGKLRQRPTTASLDLVTVDLNALRGDTTRLSIPNATTLVLSKRKVDVRGPTDFTWYGTASGVPGQATMVVHNGNITGSIQNQGTLYRIEPIGNGVHALIKVDEARFPPDHPPSFEEKERRGDIRAPATVRDMSKSDVPVGIDVLVAYTTAARNAVTDISATIQLAVAEANQSYVNSGINIKLSLVDSFEVAYSETDPQGNRKTFTQILADFVANDNVQNRRDTSGADLAAMIIDQSDYCGQADAIMATASTAFAIVHYNCATGYYSFAHELGHLMGARHDENHDPSTTPFSYGHGYEHPSPTASQSFRTIMAYACSPTSCDPRIQYWSNPNVTYNGIAIGTAAINDNARVLNETAATVAGFRSAPIQQRPYAFVRTSDNHLWVDWWNGSNWNWADQGTPTGATVAGPVGTLTVDQRPYAFVQVSDGHLWVDWWNGANWNWADQGTPTGATVAGPVGTLTVDQRPYAFVQASDGHLWVDWWSGSNWNWADQGTPTGATVAGPVGTLTVEQRPYAFVRASDGHLWVNWWDGSNWNWADQGAPTGATVAGPVGTLTVDQRPYAFVRASDGHLWVNWWNGANWNWADQGSPTAATVVGPVGTLTVDQRPYAFVQASDGHLWVDWWNGSNWNWADQGTPTGATVAGPVGTLTVDQRPYAFVRASDGHLWVNWWSGANWNWADQGLPTGATVVGPIGTLTVSP
jgi:hypothetical protein